MSIQNINRLIGLDQVVAAETALSHVDGAKGELIIAGRRVEQLSLDGDYESAVADLWSLATRESVDVDAVRRDLGAARVAAFTQMPALLALTKGQPPIDAMRSGLAAMRKVPGLSDAAVAVGAAPVIAAAVTRDAQGLKAVAPDATLGHAADFLRMLRGTAPARDEAEALDAYLVTIADHGMNASTFAARVVASTRADLFAAVTGGYCALTGPLHGGAPGPVLDMLDAIGTVDRIEAWIDSALDDGDRLMGFGHRIYRTRDPRADVLRRVLLRLGRGAGRLAFAAKVEQAALSALRRRKSGHALDTNVEFYTALLLEAIGVPRAAFTPTFAVGRMAGWTAHVLEHWRRGRLIRPDSKYDGPMP